MSIWKILYFVLCSFPILSCAAGTGQKVPPLQVVPKVDLKRYLGTWYEIARFPFRIQEGCVATRATYTELEDGRIGVLNECRRNGFDGELSSAKGKAWVVDRETRARLKVSFFWPFSGDYWIIDLGEQYDYAVVGHPDRKYLWILSRTPRMDETLYNQILHRLRMQHYDVDKLIKTPQAKTTP